MAYIGNSPGVASQRVSTTFTATAGQTTFTPVSGYTLGYCDVYQNGVKLISGDDYTAADGVSVVLGTGAAAGDAVEVVAMFPRGLSDGYTKAEADAKYPLTSSLSNVENKSSATIRSEITSTNVTDGLGYTPVNKAGDTMTGALTLNNASNGIHVQTQVAGVNAATLGSYNGAPTVGSNKAGYSGLMFNGLALEPTADGLNVRQSQVVDVGSTGYRFKTGYFTGINFPVTQVASSDANTLDDYEEGSWVPYAYISYGAGTISTVTSSGTYVKIGKQVTCWFQVVFNLSWSSGGNVGIYNLPFGASTQTNTGGAFGVARRQDAEGIIYQIEGINGDGYISCLRPYNNGSIASANNVNIAGMFTYMQV